MRHLEQQSGARSSRTSNVRSGAALRVVTLSALLKTRLFILTHVIRTYIKEKYNVRFGSKKTGDKY